MLDTKQHNIGTSADNPGVAVLPPFLYGGAFVAVLALRWIWPIPIFGHAVALWPGLALVVLVGDREVASGGGRRRVCEGLEGGLWWGEEGVGVLEFDVRRRRWGGAIMGVGTSFTSLGTTELASRWRGRACVHRRIGRVRYALGKGRALVWMNEFNRVEGLSRGYSAPPGLLELRLIPDATLLEITN
jgi:hypothetical protein